MAQLVRGNRDRGHRRAVGDSVGEKQALVTRVIMIGQIPGGALYLDPVQVAGGDQSLGSLVAGETARGAHLAPFAVGMPHIPGGQPHQDKGGDHEY